jgi:cytochrome c oxidase subunit 2
MEHLLQPDLLPSALAPAGIQASRILGLWHLTLALCALVFAGILFALLLALLRSRRAARAGASPPPDDRRSRRAVMAASLVSAVLLAALVVVDILTDRSLSRLPADDALHIEMVGHQWWWEVRYGARDGSPAFALANELQVPTGRSIVVSLKSVDVIHTFWVPNLHGKKDMLPGRASTIAFRVDREGVYRGQCAEFCGLEHALMAFFVTGVAPERYADWEAGQRRPAAAPADAEARRGLQIFLSSNCAQCHTVRGTAAEGTLGPDLTHLASRSTLGAGTVPNERARLAAWIVDPQGLKPGSTMPQSRLQPDDVRALVAYLESLK